MPKSEGDIIASSPIVTEAGCEPFRIVIRDLGHEYVVHTQVLPDIGGPGFLWGHYFRKDREGAAPDGSETTALQRAWLNFEKRSRNFLGISNP
jgi:hypothetical protein